MLWCVGQREGAYTTCSVIDYDSINHRQREHHAIGQVRSAFQRAWGGVQRAPGRSAPRVLAAKPTDSLRATAITIS